MTRQYGRKRTTEVRRLRVSRLRLRGMTVSEIMEALALTVKKGGLRNPETGDPYARATIGRDFKYLDELYQAECALNIGEHKSRQIAELREARREAWRKSDMSEVRQNLAFEAKILGTAAAEKMDINGKLGIEHTYDWSGFADEEIDRLISALGRLFGSEEGTSTP